jgi:hypothetical protein
VRSVDRRERGDEAVEHADEPEPARELPLRARRVGDAAGEAVTGGAELEHERDPVVRHGRRIDDRRARRIEGTP